MLCSAASLKISYQDISHSAEMISYLGLIEKARNAKALRAKYPGNSVLELELRTNLHRSPVTCAVNDAVGSSALENSHCNGSLDSVK